MAISKKILALAVVALLGFALAGCSNDDDGNGGGGSGDPRVRVMNQRAQVVDVRIQREPFDEPRDIDFNDIGPGVTTGYVAIPPAVYEARVRLDQSNTEATTIFTASRGESYTVVVPATNPLTIGVVSP